MPFFVRPVARAIAGRAKSSFIEPQIDLAPRLHGRRARQDAPGSPAASSAPPISQMSFPLEAAAARGGLDAARPKLMAFLERIHARPAYRHALTTGGDYSLLR